jgi:hypothetical protein
VQPPRVGAGGRHDLPHDAAQRRPPLVGVLRGGAVGADVDLHRAQRRRDDLAVETDHPDLGAAVAEVDGEDPAVRGGHPAAGPVSGAGSYIASMMPPMSWLSVPLPPGIAPRP